MLPTSLNVVDPCNTCTTHKPTHHGLSRLGEIYLHSDRSWALTCHSWHVVRVKSKIGLLVRHTTNPYRSQGTYRRPYVHDRDGKPKSDSLSLFLDLVNRLTRKPCKQLINTFVHHQPTLHLVAKLQPKASNVPKYLKFAPHQTTRSPNSRCLAFQLDEQFVNSTSVAYPPCSAKISQAPSTKSRNPSPLTSPALELIKRRLNFFKNLLITELKPLPRRCVRYTPRRKTMV